MAADNDDDYDDDVYHVACPSELNEEQQQAFNAIVNERQNAFITGDAGTGKSYLLNALVSAFDGLGVRAVVTAPTGIAALNVGGVTIYKWAGISSFEADSSACVSNIIKWGKQHSWLNVQVLFIDEISMLHEHVLTKIDHIFRQLKANPTKVFGGVQVVVVGDFLQLPPVEKGKLTPTLCFDSRSWNNSFRVFYLKTPVRQLDPEFVHCLREVRKGKLSLESIALLNTRVVSTASSVSSSPTVIYSHVADVERENRLRLNALPGAPKSYAAVLKYDEGNPRAKADAEALVNSSRSPSLLTLKVGAPVMITANVKIEDGLVNGARGTVVELEDAAVVVQLDGQNKHIVLKPHVVERRENFERTPVSFAQIPLVLAYAFTIHKAQGLTLSNFAVDLSRIFAPGQAYVALSRARTLSDFYIIGHLNVAKIVALQSAKKYYLALEALPDTHDSLAIAKKMQTLQCSAFDRHFTCSVCEAIFCDDCSESLAGFIIPLDICRTCLNPDCTPTKRQRT